MTQDAAALDKEFNAMLPLVKVRRRSRPPIQAMPFHSIGRSDRKIRPRLTRKSNCHATSSQLRPISAAFPQTDRIAATANEKRPRKTEPSSQIGAP